MIYIIITALIVSLDILTKKIIRSKIKLGEKRELIKNKVSITNVRNKGAALGILSGKPRLLYLINALSLITAMFYFAASLRKEGESLLKLALAFIIGGAVGNFSDRLKHGYVTDFLKPNVRRLPIFNIADLFLIAAPFIILIRMLFHREA